MIALTCYLLGEFAAEPNSDLSVHLQEYCQLALVVLYILQVLGMWPHPYVWGCWLLEQINIHFFGTTARASEGRIIASFVINCFFAAIILML